MGVDGGARRLLGRRRSEQRVDASDAGRRQPSAPPAARSAPRAPGPLTMVGGGGRSSELARSSSAAGGARAATGLSLRGCAPRAARQQWQPRRPARRGRRAGGGWLLLVVVRGPHHQARSAGCLARPRPPARDARGGAARIRAEERPPPRTLLGG